MVEVIKWCLELGVQHISVYAFSIENFKRSVDEVACLMHLAEEKYKELAQVLVSVILYTVCTNSAAAWPVSKVTLCFHICGHWAASNAFHVKSSDIQVTPLLAGLAGTRLPSTPWRSSQSCR